MSATATLDNPTTDPSAINEDGFTTPMVAWERFDASAQRYLGIGGSEFLARLDEGRLDLDGNPPALPAGPPAGALRATP
jgi:hypothetical protein